jgi:hypothetical protein
MKNKIIISYSFFLYSSILAQAQIGLNTKTFTGNASLGFTNSYHHKTSTNIYSAGLNPSFGKFLSQKALLTLQPHANFSRFEADSEIKNTLDASSLGLNASVRFYFYTFQRFHFYSEGSLSVEANRLKYSDSKLNTQTTKGTLDITIGTNYFLNKTIALNAQLALRTTVALPNANNFDENFNFSLNLENFINPENEEAVGETLIKKGRISIGGNFDINFNRNTTLYQLDATYSTFLANGFMVGAKINGTKNDLATKLLAVQCNSRYYFLLNKKLFLYPEMKLTYANYWFEKYYVDMNIGMNYFIKKNLALEIDLLGLSLTKAQAVTTIGANMGLKYFLK